MLQLLWIVGGKIIIFLLQPCELWEENYIILIPNLERAVNCRKLSWKIFPSTFMCKKFLWLHSLKDLLMRMILKIKNFYANNLSQRCIFPEWLMFDKWRKKLKIKTHEFTIKWTLIHPFFPNFSLTGFPPPPPILS